MAREKEKTCESKTGKKVYQKPAITFEQDLEVKAGSPIPGLPDLLEIDQND